MSWNLLWKLVLFAVCLSCGAGEEAVPKVLQGIWTIDPAASFTQLGKNPKLQDATEDDKARYARQLAKMAEMFTMTITAEKVIVQRGAKTREATLVPLPPAEDAVANSWSFEAKNVWQDASLTFFLLADGTLRFTSTATDDMDYIIWKPQAVAPADEPPDPTQIVPVIPSTAEPAPE